MTDNTFHKFIGPHHEDTEDRFRIHVGYKGKRYVYIYMETDSGVTTKILLTEGDIRQIYAKLEENE